MTDASSTKCLQPAQGSITTDTMQCILQSHSHTPVTKVHLYSNNQLTINNYKQTSNTICKIEPLKSTSNHESNFSGKWQQIQILNLLPKILATNSNFEFVANFFGNKFKNKYQFELVAKNVGNKFKI